MAKKSQRRRSRNKRDQSGCISGLISIFDFRQGRSTRKLLADERRGNKQVKVSRGQSNIQAIISCDADNYDTVEDACENTVHAPDIAKTSVKKLMEEEMINEQGSRDPIKINGKKGKHSKKNNNNRSKNISLDISELDAEHEQQPHDLVELMEELARVDLKDLSTPSNNAAPVVQENLIASVKNFLEQRMSEKSKNFGEESSEFADAVEILGSNNKGLLLKLLRDPNSTLARHIGNFEQEEAPNPFSGSNLREKSANCKHHNIFRRRRSKSLGSYPLESVEDGSDSPSRIVILKHGSHSYEADSSANNKVTTRLSDVDGKVLITRHSSQFSFTEIKRRLRHAMGKYSSPGTSSAIKVSSGQKSANLGWRSPNRNHFYTERFMLSSPMSTKRHAKACASKEKGFVDESEKHLSELLKNGDESGEFVGDVQLRKPLGTILSLPSYSSSPCCSPRGEDLESKRKMASGNFKDNVESLDQECSLKAHSAEDVTVHEDAAKIGIEAETEEDEDSVGVSRESSDCSVADDPWNGDPDGENVVIYSEEESSPCLKSHLSEEDQCLSSITTSPADRPSPVSILEPLFTDDEISPQSTTPSPAEKGIEPIQIRFHEQAICTRISPEDEESAFEYVEAVLLGSGLDWDEFSLRWLSHNEILDPSLFEEVELFSSRARHNQKLLFDCSNEALQEICQIHLTPFKGTPCPRGVDLIGDVWHRVETLLTSNPQHLSLDQHVRRDLKGSGKWMELRLGFEVIGEETEDAIFDELVEEIVLTGSEGCSGQLS